MAPEREGFLDLVSVQAAPPQRGDEIRLLTLERYEDGFIIRHALPSGPSEMPATAEEAGLNPMGLLSLTIKDDVGTQYDSFGMISGTSQGLTMFRPAIPAEAAWLDVLVKEGFVRFELGSG
jgi:hypothetical protein